MWDGFANRPGETDGLQNRPTKRSVGSALAATGVRAADTGFQAEVTVKQPTRLDWEFVASGFGREALKLPGDFSTFPIGLTAIAHQVLESSFLSLTITRLKNQATWMT